MCGDFHSSMSTLKALLRSKDVLCLLQQIAAPRRAGAARLPLPRPCGRRDTLSPPHPPGSPPAPRVYIHSEPPPLPPSRPPPPRGREKGEKRERTEKPRPSPSRGAPEGGGGGVPAFSTPTRRGRPKREEFSLLSKQQIAASLMLIPPCPCGKINPRHLPRSGEERGQRKPQTHQVRPEPTETAPNPPNFFFKTVAQLLTAPSPSPSLPRGSAPLAARDPAPPSPPPAGLRPPLPAQSRSPSPLRSALGSPTI